jgi:hypothetical protein
LPFDETAPRQVAKAASKKAAVKPTQDTQEKYEAIKPMITAFCNKKLGGEFIEPCLNALETLRRKRPSPLLSGRANIWACGIVYAIAANNRVFDKAKPYYMSAQEIADGFSLPKGTAVNKAADINKMLNISSLALEYNIESLRAGNKAMLEIKNTIVALTRKMK